MAASVLFVLTSADTMLTGEPTGWNLPEAARAYYVLSPHYSITFTAPAGPNPPLDPTSARIFKEDPDSIKFLADETVQQKLASALLLRDVKLSDYDVLYYVGGHGPMIDLVVDPVNTKLLEDAVRQKKIISGVCHGTGAFVRARVEQRPFFYGKKITGFSNVEEEVHGSVKGIPFLLEDRLIELGGIYSKAAEPLGAHVLVDGDLISGQNPASAQGVGEAIHAALQQRIKSADWGYCP